MSKFNFMHTLSEAKSIFAIEQKLLFHALQKRLRFYWDTQYIVDDTKRDLIMILCFNVAENSSTCYFAKNT